MLEFVIDTNVVMSMLISGKAQYRTVLSFFKFYLPEFSLTELEEYKSVIFKKSKFSKTELMDFIYFTVSSISVIPHFALSKENISEANKICKNVDVKDVSFLALSMDTNLTLLTRDIPLYHGIRKKGYRNVMLFKDFLDKL